MCIGLWIQVSAAQGPSQALRGALKRVPVARPQLVSLLLLFTLPGDSPPRACAVPFSPSQGICTPSPSHANAALQYWQSQYAHIFGDSKYFAGQGWSPVSPESKTPSPGAPAAPCRLHCHLLIVMSCASRTRRLLSGAATFVAETWHERPSCILAPLQVPPVAHMCCGSAHIKPPVTQRNTSSLWPAALRCCSEPL